MYDYRLEHASRSCSTWVAVGDVTSTSQLPSPHGGHTTSNTPAPPPPAITAADLIRSVNKKVGSILLYLARQSEHTVELFTAITVKQLQVAWLNILLFTVYIVTRRFHYVTEELLGLKYFNPLVKT